MTSNDRLKENIYVRNFDGYHDCYKFKYKNLFNGILTSLIYTYDTWFYFIDYLNSQYDSLQDIYVLCPMIESTYQYDIISVLGVNENPSNAINRKLNEQLGLQLKSKPSVNKLSLKINPFNPSNSSISKSKNVSIPNLELYNSILNIKDLQSYVYKPNDTPLDFNEREDSSGISIIIYGEKRFIDQYCYWNLKRRTPDNQLTPISQVAMIPVPIIASVINKRITRISKSLKDKHEPLYSIVKSNKKVSYVN